MKIHLMTLILTVFFLVSCQVTKVNSQGNVKLPVEFDNVQTLPTYNANLSQWWQEWNDAELTALINEGLTNNNSIKKAQQNIEIAKAYQTIVRADLWPMLGLMGRKSRLNKEMENPDLKEVGVDGINSSLDSKQLGVLAQWDIDFFGQKINRAEAAYYNLLTTKEMFHVSQMALSSRIAENYFDAIAIQYQIQMTDEALNQLQRLLKYTKARFNAGQTTPNEVSKTRANISQLAAQRESLTAQFDNIQQSIAVLIGKSPQGYQLKYNMRSLDNLPTIPTGVKPSEIVYRRPDLMARQKQISALAANTAAAKADLFPKFYIKFGLLDGKIGINSIAKNKFTGPLFDIGVHLPIFTAGKIRANIKANEAILQRALYDYDDALLGALKEIDTAYRWRIAYDKSINRLTNTENIFSKRNIDSSKLFKYGEITYEQVSLNYLDYLKSKEETIRQKLNAARVTILLYQALGGGWRDEQKYP